MSGIETITPWMQNPVVNQGIPDHRTYEQRILAALEEIRRGQSQTFMRVDLCYHVLQEIRDLLRKQDPTPTKPKARK